MRISSAAAVFALLTGVLLTGALTAPACAQKPSINLLQDNSPPKSQEQKDAEAARDKAYREFAQADPGRQSVFRSLGQRAHGCAQENTHRGKTPAEIANQDR